MQTQSPFGPLLGIPPSLLPSPVTVAAAAAAGHPPPVSLATFPSAFAAFASQIRNTQLQSLLQSQLQSLNGGLGSPGNGPGTPLSRNNYGSHLQTQQNQNGGKVRGTTEYPLRKRVGGSTVKTAKVWRYFDELPTIEQAAECRICRKKIKATNSSTTGMIRHLRSCHVQEYQLVQEARQNSMIVKMEEKARAKLLREMNEKVITNGIENHPMVVVKKESQPSESQKSPSASSSASDTASSASSSHFSTNPLIGLPAPVAIKPCPTPSTILNLSQSQNQCQNQNPLFKLHNIKSEATEVEEEETEQKCPPDIIHRPTDLSSKMQLISPKSMNLSSAFSSIPSIEEKKTEMKIENDHKIHMQIALMLLLDQQPSHLIDRPGFRSLFKFLLPDYHLPSGDIFQATIVPQLLNHMKLQIGAIFNNGNSNSSSGSIPDQVMTSSSATSSYEDNSVNESQIAGPNTVDEEEELMEEEIEEDENVDIEDDTSSASSSVDNETCDAMASFIHFIGNDAFPHDELISLLSVVTNLFTYFSTRPHVQSHLQMTIPQSTPQSLLVQQVRFVASNLSIISDYIRHTPDMQLLPLSVNQETMLEKLVDHIDHL